MIMPPSTASLQFSTVYVTYTKVAEDRVLVSYLGEIPKEYNREVLLSNLRTIRQDHASNSISLQIDNLIHWLEQE